MPNWSEEPPPEPDGYALRILRTPGSLALIADVTSVEVVGCCTHYANNRTIPCEGTDQCHWCRDGHSWRWHGYLAALMTSSLEHFLFEFTARAADTFKNYSNIHPTLRGCHFKAIRPSGRTNGRVLIHCRPGDEGRIRLPDPPDIKAILCHIWNIQNTEAALYKIPDRIGTAIGVAPSNKDGRNRP